ncbi:Protein SVP26 [Penicillium rolfsii]|nr:Protein SVP26 [Penicillium rolfsii]
MWILPLVGYLGVIVGFAFLTLAIASGLYYLSELVEEHTVFARRLLYRLIYTIISIQVLLVLIDRFPISLSLLSIISHLVYASNLRRFPIVKLTDPLFILSCVLVLLNHWLWFRHFSKPLPASRRNEGSWRQPYQIEYENMPSFSEVASYFGLCVWLVPFALFVSLSAGENVLPSMGSEYATGERTSGLGHSRGASNGKAKNKGMAKALVDNVRDWAQENGELLGFWRGERTRRF